MFTYTIVQRTDIPASRAGYLLPFQDAPLWILQGFNGPVSHVLFEGRSGDTVIQQDDRFSIDFALPLGTKVIAAKAGKVRSVYDSSDQWYEGLDLMTGIRAIVNSITLRHEDGTATLYSHLGKCSAQVRDGQQVEQGQLLAVTGMSGWIGPVPHLHFAALRYEGGGFRRTFPIEFENYQGNLEHEALMAQL